MEINSWFFVPGKADDAIFLKKIFSKKGGGKGVDILHWVKYLDIKISVYFQQFWATLCLYAVVSSWTNSQKKHPPFSKKKMTFSLKLQPISPKLRVFPAFWSGCQLGGITEQNHPPFPHHWKVHTLNFFSSYYHFLRKCIVLAVQTQILKTD